MKPYYEHGGITIYHGDCLDVLGSVLGKLCVVTDPPYGTGWVRGGRGVGEFDGQYEKPDWDVWDERWMDLVKPQCWAIFCPDLRVADIGRRFAKFSMRYYVKTNPRPPMAGKDSPSVEPIVVSPRVRFGDGPAHFSAYNGDSPLHPCQKPEALMRWLVLGVADPSEIVVDPFCGSGTTLRAAKDLGRKAIGIEREERYCEIAAKRLAQEMLFT